MRNVRSKREETRRCVYFCGQKEFQLVKGQFNWKVKETIPS